MKNAHITYFNVTQNRESKEIVWLESEEIVPRNQINDLDSIVVHAKIFTCCDVEIGHVVIREAIANIEESGFKNAIELAEKEHSDLIVGKYEGGLKIWECTHDLIKYLIENKVPLENSKILDLGCGAGILGIYAFMNGANVTFQDYNKEVVEYVTIPNLLLNIEEEDRESEIKRCKFYSGDWASFNKILPDGTIYDVILTSETIYNDSNYEKLTKLFIDRLSEQGTIFVAAKTCYFGVGGGMRQFEQYIQKNECLQSEIIWRNINGIQREIMKITRKL
ncbi:hypothetical protein O3G_MSEX001355 [Manduca sexta]|uniref:Histidine protein methyltransferase 1 homolog n=1 Tax=Manduca sexta TaxID=7130 RepID=A0A921YK02_MANSE|nr:hypothetical protein O3G_MSEX001355 [Manduca sexta]